MSIKKDKKWTEYQSKRFNVIEEEEIYFHITNVFMFQVYGTTLSVHSCTET